MPVPLGGAELLESRHLLALTVTPLGDQSLPAADLGAEYDLAGRFRLPEVNGSVVRVATNAKDGPESFYVELFDAAGSGTVRSTPVSARNFLDYVTDGSFDRSIIHRSVPGFVIQGGGFTAPVNPADQPDGSPVPIFSKGSIADEIGNPNLRGTLAIAKLASSTGSSVPNSGSSQWFVNIYDNPHLDEEYAAFGRILGDGMETVEELASALPYDVSDYFLNDALTDLPLWSVSDDNVIRPDDFVTITSMANMGAGGFVTLTAETSNPAVATAEVIGSRLVVSRVAASGSVEVIVRGVSLLDPADSGEFRFNITISSSSGGTIETAGAVTLAYDASNNLRANGTIVTVNGAPIRNVTDTNATWRYVAADVDNGRNTLVLRHSSGAIYFWRFDAAWNQTGGDSWTAAGTNRFFEAERKFGVDFNGDGLVPIEWAGSVTLATDAAGNLRANGTQLSFNNAPIKHVTDPNAVWRYMAADVESGQNTLVLRNNSGALYYWRMDSNWRQIGGDNWTPAGTARFAAAETTFGVDFDGNGTIGS